MVEITAIRPALCRILFETLFDNELESFGSASRHLAQWGRSLKYDRADNLGQAHSRFGEWMLSAREPVEDDPAGEYVRSRRTGFAANLLRRHVVHRSQRGAHLSQVR